MKVKDKMTARIELIPADESATAAATRMRDADVGCLPVVDGDQLIGIVTDRDIVCRALADDRDPRNVAVRDIMTEGCTTVSVDASPQECAGVMQAARVHRVVVIDAGNRPVGMISSGDLAQLDPGVAGQAIAGITST